MPIRILPSALVNQIAAGEVVERPASVVKELVENALDAGARRVIVHIEGGGAELVRVSDDGVGIAAEELPLAVATHATSKVATSEDLAAIGTFGFRGEALASIASVSRFRIASYVRGNAEGAEIVLDGAAVVIDERIAALTRPAAARPGTVVEVRTLFFNVPARRKFLRSDSAETSRVSDAIEALALTHPHVAFEFRSNDRLMFELAPTDEPKKRMLDILGAELAPELLEFEQHFPELGNLCVRGFAGRPGIARANSRAIRIHLNGRPIMDRLVLHAVREAYRGLLDSSRTPTVALMLEIDPHEVDVNVHPAKSEVRFRSQQGIHSAVRRTIEQRLRAANLVPTFVPDAMRTRVDVAPSARAPLFGSGLAHTRDEQAHGRVDFSAFAAMSSSAIADTLSRPTHEVDAHATTERVTDHADHDEFAYIQLLDGFLVTEDADGIVIVDQHALHERAMFAMFMQRLEAGPLESQRLLVPVILERSAREMTILEELAPVLARLGMEIRAFGARSIAVESVATLLLTRRVDVGEFVAELLDKAAEHGSLLSFEAALHEVVDMMACKAAVKAGDALGAREIRDLLRMRTSIERASACPHGRPTSIRIARSELDRRFGRS